MWFPILEHNDSVIEAQHSEGRWRFRQRRADNDNGFVVMTRGEETPGLGWLLDREGPAPITGLHHAARTVMRGARDYMLREMRTAWWFTEVDQVSGHGHFEALAEELQPELLRWNAHIVHHHEMVRGWRERHVETLPFCDLEALLLTGKLGPTADRVWDRYIPRLEAIATGGVPGPEQELATFESSFDPPGSTANQHPVRLVQDDWHFGLTFGEDEAVALPPNVGAELAWRLASISVSASRAAATISGCPALSAPRAAQRHHQALADDVVMLAHALRYVPDPREPFTVLVHGRCVIQLRWRLGAWEWSASYVGSSQGYWRRGELAPLLRSDLLHVGVPTYIHPIVASRLRDVFELTVTKMAGPSHSPEHPEHPDTATWRELLSWAESGQVVDCVIRGDLLRQSLSLSRTWSW